MDRSYSILFFLAFLIPFLIGAFPTGYVLGKLKNIDIRKHGSGNIGAGNVSRTLGFSLGILTYIVDGLKAFCAVFFVLDAFFLIATKNFGYDVSYELLQFVFGTAVVLGNIFNPFLGFKGGKGIATLAGTMAGISLPVLGIALLAFLIFFISTEILSFSSIIAVATAVVASAFFHSLGILPLHILIFSGVMFVLILFSHRENLKRLRNGTEEKFSMRRKK